MVRDVLVPRAADAIAWVLASDEASARRIVRAEILADPAGAAAERTAVLADPGTEALLERLGDWTAGVVASGHASPAYLPNLLALLADLGVGPGDDPRVEALLDALLDHRLPDGRFAAGARARGSDEPTWGSLLCDTHLITEVLVRFGRGEDPRVAAALELTVADLERTAQGVAWPCRPDPVTGFRGPGRRGDLCPQATLEAVRAWSWLPPERRPAEVRDAARVLLAVWRARGTAKPYMFGHGRQFKVIKWPVTWYGAFSVLEALSGWPEVWAAEAAEPAERGAVAELLACLVAYNVADDGLVTPQSCFRGFETYSFGQKRRPSPFATARVHQVLHRYAALAEEAAAVDVAALGSSKGGTGVPVPPRAALRSGGGRPR